MQKFISILSIIIVFAFYKNCNAEDNNDISKQVYTIEALKKDFQTWQTTLEKTHANLYLYNSKERLDIIFDSMYQHINQPMTALEFYAYISPLVSVIKDGHNYIHPGDALVEYYNKNELFFPFHVTFSTDKKLYVDMNLSGDSTILIGSEIISINGLPSEKIWNELLKRQPRDGYNETYPTWILNNWFREYYSYVFGHPTNFELEIKTAENDIIKKNVHALNKETITANRKKIYPERQMVNESKEAIRLKQMDSIKTAILKIKTFSGKIKKEYHQAFKKTISKIFKQIANAQTENLILDLRNNQGGAASYGIYLVSHLLNQPFFFTKEYNSVRKNNPRISENSLKRVRNGLSKIKKPNKDNFKGKLYVLINGGSFSCSGMVCSCLESNNRATFIGEETGGNRTVLTSLFGLKTKTVLPNTKIVCDKPNYQTIIKDIALNDGHGTFPTHLVQSTINDIIENKDVVLEYTLKLIHKK